MKVRSEFSVAQWNETKCGKPVNNTLLSKVSAVFEISGTITGKFDVEYLMHYTDYDEANQHNSTATYVGYLTFSGSMNEKSGSFVLEDKGVYSSLGPVSALTIKSGIGDFKGISGTGKYFAENGKMIIEMEYSV
jgi:hypothetical protein